jgi:hypothetical protein
MTDPFVGKVIDRRYEIQARIGEGGHGPRLKMCQPIAGGTLIIAFALRAVGAEYRWLSCGAYWELCADPIDGWLPLDIAPQSVDLHAPRH